MAVTHISGIITNFSEAVHFHNSGNKNLDFGTRYLFGKSYFCVQNIKQ